MIAELKVWQHNTLSGKHSNSYDGQNKADQFPDEDEEYEILYQQELEASTASNNTNVQEVFQEKSDDFGGLSGIAASVNRRLFGTPVAERITSTPVVGQVKAPDKYSKPTGSRGLEPIQNEPRLKRRLDLFGDDFLSIDATYVDPIAKKMRVEEERDLNAIEAILELRRSKNTTGETNKAGSVQYLEKLRDFKMRNLSYTVPQWPFQPLQRSDQHRIYVRFHSEDFENRAIHDISAKPDMVVFSTEDKQKLWNEANNIILQRAEARSSEEQNVGNDLVCVQTSEERLWVEKYRPQQYRDLLSAETTNRSLLFWLKMWDKVVFGKEFKPVSESVENAHKLNTFNKRIGKFESNGGWLQRKQRQSLNTNTDEHGRPMQKVALLHGAPGLGKTTLAHILARHAGYQPIEINASDDRSPTSFQHALENGTQMSSVLNDNGRPNCIILDEIDGAPKQSIEFLVKFVSDNIQIKRPKAGGKVKKNFLRRPIICICNDLYEPALRSLRQVAFIVQFPPIETSRLEERLRQIARIERMKTDANALFVLSEKTGNDVRCCISTMQFFKGENKAITLHEVLKSNVSRKDQHQGLFTAWSKIFQIQRPTEKHEVHHGNEELSKARSDSERTQSILSCVQSVGDYQRLMQGVYENFLQQKMPDANMYGVVEALDWFVFFDTVQQQINHKQNYTIYPYLPIGFVKWNLLFASLAWPNIRFPTKGYEYNQKGAAQRNIFESFRKGLQSSHCVLGLGIGKVILLEAVPILKHILSPELRHLPTELFSQNEKEILKHTIDIMIDLGLTYLQLKSQEGSYQFQMEPAIETLVQFPCSVDSQLTYFTKQMLSREIALERIRRATPKFVGGSNKYADREENASSKKASNPAQKLQPKMDMTVKLKPTCNLISKYFSNFVKQKPERTSPSSNALEPPKSDPIVKSPIWYHYKEGFNNAVRKDVHIKDLL